MHAAARPPAYLSRNCVRGRGKAFFSSTWQRDFGLFWRASRASRAIGAPKSKLEAGGVACYFFAIFWYPVVVEECQSKPRGFSEIGFDSSCDCEWLVRRIFNIASIENNNIN